MIIIALPFEIMLIDFAINFIQKIFYPNPSDIISYHRDERKAKLKTTKSHKKIEVFGENGNAILN